MGGIKRVDSYGVMLHMQGHQNVHEIGGGEAVFARKIAKHGPQTIRLWNRQNLWNWEYKWGIKDVSLYGLELTC